MVCWQCWHLEGETVFWHLSVRRNDMSHNGLLASLRKICRRLVGVEPDRLVYMRLTLLLTGFFTVFVGLPLHIAGYIGMQHPCSYAVSVAWWFSSCCLLCLFVLHRISLERTTFCFFVMVQVWESVSIVVLSFLDGNIVGPFLLSEFVCYTALLFMVMGFMKWGALTVSLVNFVTLLWCHFRIPHVSDTQAIFILVFLSLVTMCYAFVVSFMLEHLHIENVALRNDMKAMLKLLRVSREELVVLLQLVRGSGSDDVRVRELISRLKEETKANVVSVAHCIESDRLLAVGDFEELFPQLTPTELEICRLVVKGGTLKDIARVMGKSISNVSTVRGNVRRKLGLTPDIDLREYLSDSIRHG